MEPIEEGVKCYDQMLIVEKYEKVISYLYPIAQSLPRARYMDDIVVLGDDPEELRQVFYNLRDFAAEHLKLRIGHWQVAPISRGINFLGYRIWPSHKLLRKDSVTRAKRKVANFIKHGEDEGLQKFLASWSGHAMWADANHLFTWLENRHGIALH